VSRYALTILHNFGLKRADGTIAAQHLFNHPFPDLFAWGVQRMSDLPMARRSPKAHRSNSLLRNLFPLKLLLLENT
jgi:Family of unknown function (DUF6399)